jgi:hypothetical protein
MLSVWHPTHTTFLAANVQVRHAAAAAAAVAEAASGAGPATGQALESRRLT